MSERRCCGVWAMRDEPDSDDDSIDGDAEGECATMLPVAASDDDDASDVRPTTSKPSQSTAAGTAEPVDHEEWDLPTLEETTILRRAGRSGRS
jgi:hypothetical protein